MKEGWRPGAVHVDLYVAVGVPRDGVGTIVEQITMIELGM